MRTREHKDEVLYQQIRSGILAINDKKEFATDNDKLAEKLRRLSIIVAENKTSEEATLVSIITDVIKEFPELLKANFDTLKNQQILVQRAIFKKKLENALPYYLSVQHKLLDYSKALADCTFAQDSYFFAICCDVFKAKINIDSPQLSGWIDLLGTRLPDVVKKVYQACVEDTQKSIEKTPTIKLSH
jgi:hypothetical protein